MVLTLFRMRCQKDFPTILSAQTSRSVGISSKIVWLLVSNLLPHLPKIWRPFLMPVANYWTWTKSTLQKEIGFSGQILIKLSH